MTPRYAMLASLALVMASAATAVTTPAAPVGPKVAVTKSCGDESGPELYPCAWDARHEGNGKGRSYVVGRGGKARYVAHVYAHRLRGF